jgi:hypothetical protein
MTSLAASTLEEEATPEEASPATTMAIWDRIK